VRWSGSDGADDFGDRQHKMPNVTGGVIPNGVNADGVRTMMLDDFGIEIGTSFGPLHGKIWRIGTMGYVFRKETAPLPRRARRLPAPFRLQGAAGRRGRCGAGGLQ
jgi:aspartate aminotransferase-like enzyme